MPHPLCKRLLLSFPRSFSAAAAAAASTASSASAVIQFLTDTCGLPPPAAASAALSLRLKSRSLSGPRSVVDLLLSHNFSKPQIAALVSARPSLLRSHPDRLLRPKLRLLASAAGAARLPDLVTANPGVLHRSLDNHLKPALDLLQSFSASPDSLLLAVRRNRWLLTCNFRATLLPNITLLLSRGVPIPNISKLLAAHPNALLQPASHFAEAVALAEAFNMKPHLSLFVHAIRALAAMKRSTRDARFGLLRSWGWSDDDISAAFRRAPLFVLVSDKKLKRAVDFLVNTVGLGQRDLSVQPKLLMYSLEKRIMPRFAVFRALEAKGLASKGSDGKVVSWLFICSERVFFDRYVKKYSEDLPELNDLYCVETGVAEIEDSRDMDGL